MNTAVNNVKTYAWTSTTIISKPAMAAAIGTATSETPIPAAALLNISPKIAISDRSASNAMWPPVILAARRMVNANGFTNNPMTSMGIKMM